MESTILQFPTEVKDKMDSVMSPVSMARRSAEMSASSRIYVRNSSEPPDWQILFDRIRLRLRWLPFAFHGGVVVATLCGLGGAFFVLLTLFKPIFPHVSPAVLGCLLLPPALLMGAAAGYAGGNTVLRLWLGINEDTRRGFALRLTLGRSSVKWPNFLKRWLFSGNWLANPHLDHCLPYVRAFIVGDAPGSCAEEAKIWKEIQSVLALDSTWEAGGNHREISYPETLPEWADSIQSGDGVEELGRLIGYHQAQEWVRHVWSRGYRQWPILGTEAFPEYSSEELFEIHRIALSNGRDALITILRPTLSQDEASSALMHHIHAA